VSGGRGIYKGVVGFGLNREGRACMKKGSVKGVIDIKGLLAISTNEGGLGGIGIKPAHEMSG
jgi:hypothetical protein